MKRSLVVVALLWIASTAAHAQFMPTSFSPSTSKSLYSLGEPVTLILTNMGMSPYTFTNPGKVINTCFIYNSSGQMVFNGFQLVTAEYIDPLTVYPGQTCTATWRQTINGGGQVGPGTYYFNTNMFDAGSTQFQITPEPSSIIAMLGGLASLGLMITRKRQ